MDIKAAMANDFDEVDIDANDFDEVDIDANDIDSAWSKFCNDDPPLPPIKTIDVVTSKEAIPKC